MESLILLVQITSTLFMTGLIWMTQLAQYPSFQAFREKDFAESHGIYRVRIAFIATPVMNLEMVSSIALLIKRPEYIGGASAWIGFFLVSVVWASMFFLQVPLHSKLSKGFDVDAARRLVSTNWIRTAAWTIRSVIVIFWLSNALNR